MISFLTCQDPFKISEHFSWSKYILKYLYRSARLKRLVAWPGSRLRARRSKSCKKYFQNLGLQGKNIVWFLQKARIFWFWWYYHYQKSFCFHYSTFLTSISDSLSVTVAKLFIAITYVGQSLQIKIGQDFIWSIMTVKSKWFYLFLKMIANVLEINHLKASL